MWLIGAHTIIELSPEMRISNDPRVYRPEALVFQGGSVIFRPMYLPTPECAQTEGGCPPANPAIYLLRTEN